MRRMSVEGRRSIIAPEQLSATRLLQHRGSCAYPHSFWYEQGVVVRKREGNGRVNEKFDEKV